ncbi:hypothetical protein ACHAXA_008733 [Cyclostephanos tholiformis]|uniref:Transmembrane protein n=1 Tax=Cyclostephanos tholiformis TaxID=382380 RepID=A0ABD3RBA2_9STRA
MKKTESSVVPSSRGRSSSISSNAGARRTSTSPSPSPFGGTTRSSHRSPPAPGRRDDGDDHGGKSSSTSTHPTPTVPTPVTDVLPRAYTGQSLQSTNGSSIRHRPPSRPHKGFSTPLCGLFARPSPSPASGPLPRSPPDHHRRRRRGVDDDDDEMRLSNARSDLCSLPCFGILQSDHTRYLFTHVRPPTLFKRVSLHFLIPISIFLLAGWCSGNIRNDYVNSIVCTSLVYFIALWIVTGCLRGRKKRVMVREEILWRLRRRDERVNARRRLELSGSSTYGVGGGDIARASGGVGQDDDGLRAAISSERDRHVDGLTSADVARASLDEDYQYYSEDEWEYQHRAEYDKRTLGQTRCEMNCAHRAIGCYPSDYHDGGTAWEDDDDDDGGECHSDVHPDQDHDDDACTRPWRVISRPCLPCVPCCNGSRGFHLQYCGLCALAQEAREANATLPRHLRMIDHVTLEPFLSYYPTILELRVNFVSSFYEHVRALSELSKLLLVTFKMMLVALLVISLSSLVGYWNISDLCVLITTFLQSFAVAYCVHWGWHRYDLSVDAVIKYFATGLVLCTSMAFTVELFGYLLFALAVKIITVNVREVQDNGYGDAGGIHVAMADAWKNGRYLKFFGLDNEDHVVHGRSLTAGSDILDGFFDRQPAAKILYILVSSYLITSLVEEVCKYFGFIMVDHPDFCSERELAKAKATLRFHLQRDDTDDDDDDENEAASTYADATSKRIRQ